MGLVDMEYHELSKGERARLRAQAVHDLETQHYNKRLLAAANTEKARESAEREVAELEEAIARLLALEDQ